MSAVTQLLAAYDDSWSHKWESIQSVLPGITEEMAAWQPPGYGNVTQYPEDPPNGTILWYLSHLENCMRHYAAALRARPEKVTTVPLPVTLSAKELIAALTTTFNNYRDVIASLREEELEETLPSGATVASFVRVTIRHNAWHAGQIAVVKRLYEAMRTR